MEVAVFYVNPASINDLLALKSLGASVTLTSHPGNASLYKLSLWQCGIPETFWDVTCCKADANNWPMYQLKDGKAELLVTEELYQRVMSEVSPTKRFVTAYQKTRSGERLGRFHVRACEQLFPSVISSCSRLILSEIDMVEEMFEYLLDTGHSESLGRYVTPDGLLIPSREAGVSKSAAVRSFTTVLRELNHLLFSDEPIVTQGGACYDGVMVQLTTSLVDYWRTDRVDRYDLSGPDMIHYASRKQYQEEVSQMLRHLSRWNPKLVPKSLVTRMFPGTYARVGHISGHQSEVVMQRKLDALRNYNQDDSHQKRLRWAAAEGDEQLWPIQIKPSEAPYFSQHDLADSGGRLTVDEFWKDVPIEEMRNVLIRANGLLRLK